MTLTFNQRAHSRKCNNKQQELFKTGPHDWCQQQQWRRWHTDGKWRQKKHQGRSQQQVNNETTIKQWNWQSLMKTASRKAVIALTLLETLRQWAAKVATARTAAPSMRAWQPQWQTLKKLTINLRRLQGQEQQQWFSKIMPQSAETMVLSKTGTTAAGDQK